VSRNPKEVSCFSSTFGNVDLAFRTCFGTRGGVVRFLRQDHGETADFRPGLSTDIWRSCADAHWVQPVTVPAKRLLLERQEETVVLL
jgi:hypothetical protein